MSLEDKRLVGMVVPLPWPMAVASLDVGRVRPKAIAKLPFRIEHSGTGTRFIMFPSSTDSEANSQMLYAIEEIQGHGTTFDRK